MFRRTTIILLELLAALTAGMAILAGIAVWRLSAGPISLAFLTPYIEQALNPEDTAFEVRVEDTVLTWAGWQRPIDVRARGVQIRATGETAPRAILPQVSIGLSARALFRGIVAPTTLEIYQPSVHLTRAEDGRFELGLSDRAGGDETTIQGVMAGLIAPPDYSQPTGYLETVRIRGAELTLDDRLLGLSWVVPSTDIVLARDELGVRAAVELAVEVEGERAELSGEVVYDLEEQTIEFTADFTNVHPVTYSAPAPLLAPLAIARVPLDGTIGVRIDAAGTVENAWFDMTGGPGKLTVPTLEQDLSVRRFRFRGRVEDAMAVWEFDDIYVDLGGPTLAGTGTVAAVGDDVRVSVQAKLRNISAGNLTKHWPRRAAAEVRDWIKENLLAGTAHEINVHLEARAPRDQMENISIESVAATASYSGVKLRYHDELPPLDDVAGTATLDPTRFDFQIKSGLLGKLRLQEAGISIFGIGKEDQDVETQFVVRGQLRDLLEALDSPFIGFTSEIGLDPASVSGIVAVHTALRFPIKKDLTEEQIQRVAAANMTGVTLERGPFGLKLSEGQFTVDYKIPRMETRGTVRLNGVPSHLQWIENDAPDAEFQTRFIVRGVLSNPDWEALGYGGVHSRLSGVVPIEVIYTDIDHVNQDASIAANLRDAEINIPRLHWSKPVGVEGNARLQVKLVDDVPTRVSEFKLEAGDLSASGEATIDAGGVMQRMQFDELVFGGQDGIDVGMHLNRRPDGGLDIAIFGEKFNAEPYLAAEESMIDFPLTLTTNVKRVRLSDTRNLLNVSMAASFDGELWRATELHAEMVEGGKLELRYRPYDDKQQLIIFSDNAGAALRSFSDAEMFTAIEGGQLGIVGVKDPAEEGRPLRGRVQISDFRLDDAPFMARFLSAASGRGMGEFLTGDDMSFKVLTGSFTFTDTRTELERLWATSLGIAVYAQGYVDKAEDYILVTGHVTPFEAINRLLRQFPFHVGRALVGLDEKGIIGLPFRIEGPLDEPDAEMDTSPAALAPGILRDIVEMIGGGPKDLTPETRIVPQGSRDDTK